MMNKQSVYAIAVIAALASTPLFFITTTTYAQQAAKSCPEDFTLNKGKCEMEPETTTTTTPATCSETMNELRVTVTSDGKCSIEGNGVTPDGCGLIGGNFFVRPLPDGQNVCVFEPNIPGETITETTCSLGTLNEETNKCEIRPGRNGS